MFAPHLRHQVFAGWLYISIAVQVDILGIGSVFIAPGDVVIDGGNTYQPVLIYVSNEREHIFDGHGVTGAPDVVVEILSASTRQRDLTEKLPTYLEAGVSEVWFVDMENMSVSIFAPNGFSLTPAQVFAAHDTLTSDALPGVMVDLAPIFVRVQSVPAFDG